MSNFSERITDIMAKKNLTQKQLAQMAHVTESAMSYYVNGDRTPRIDVLRRLASALVVTTDYLLGADEPSVKDESKLQYLQRILSKMDTEQLEKTEKLLRVVFDDLFVDEDVHSESEQLFLPDEDLKFLYRDDVTVPETRVIKLFNDITDIDKTGISFIDGSKIDFEDCMENWSGGRTRCVGARDTGGDPPYIDFTTSGKATRILFLQKNSIFFKRRKNYSEFNTVRREIEALGYKTYDLT